MWIPETGDAYCWIQGEVENTSVSEEKSKKGTIISNKVTLKIWYWLNVMVMNTMT